MIILCQDKKTIVNFNQAYCITTDVTNNRRIIAYFADRVVSIGLYPTTGRAEEVIKEIVGKYRSFNVDNNESVTLRPKVFEMPEN